ncbi:sugar transferase [Acidicapsa acidisoli]|uniref:sugar transferase n=1 Tax=Acidicapsa acidisoli TaxID=1615681 RepID=UPI0021E02B76|nr:sugar transferase [Acidicapsa acidisoli]
MSAAPPPSPLEWSDGNTASQQRTARGSAGMWMILDAFTVFGAAWVAAIIELHTSPIAGMRGFWRGTLIRGQSMGILTALIIGFTITLIATSRSLHLYTPTRLTNHLHEQRLSVQACLVSGLLLTGTLYLIKAEEIPRSVVMLTIVLLTISLSARRLVFRALLYQRFERGMNTRNVIIVGTGAEAHALRHHLQSIRQLGYNFKGFVNVPGVDTQLAGTTGDVLGTLDSLFDYARKHFVDEIFFTSPCERGVIKGVLDQARLHGIDLRVVPDMYDGLAWNSTIEYIGQFPTIPLHRGHVPEVGLILKRLLDITVATIALVAFAPILLAIAIAVRLDSPGPILYTSERIGKKARVFKCIKFRTMVRDADRRRAEILHMNEREGILFKMSNDPRITKVGRFLRKYSLDGLPQFFNVLLGDMSVVGPRPPIASEVRQYNLSHLRRLDVTPGITGLWQVQARQDPSFDSYISLDVAYIENWSVWLDIKIILRTIGVVFAGTGS